MGVVSGFLFNVNIVIRLNSPASLPLDEEATIFQSAVRLTNSWLAFLPTFLFGDHYFTLIDYIPVASVQLMLS